MRRLTYALVLASVLMLGCGSDPSPVSTGASQYQTGSPVYATGAGTYTSTTYGSASGAYGPVAATSSTWPQASSSLDPAAGTGVEARITEEHVAGFFHPTRVVSVQLVNHDALAHDGFVIATFQGLTGTNEYAYRYVSLASKETRTLSLQSQASAQGVTIAFRSKFL